MNRFICISYILHFRCPQFYKHYILFNTWHSKNQSVMLFRMALLIFCIIIITFLFVWWSAEEAVTHKLNFENDKSMISNIFRFCHFQFYKKYFTFPCLSFVNFDILGYARSPPDLRGGEGTFVSFGPGWIFAGKGLKTQFPSIICIKNKQQGERLPVLRAAQNLQTYLFSKMIMHMSFGLPGSLQTTFERE